MLSGTHCRLGLVVASALLLAMFNYVIKLPCCIVQYKNVYINMAAVCAVVGLDISVLIKPIEANCK